MSQSPPVLAQEDTRDNHTTAVDVGVPPPAPPPRPAGSPGPVQRRVQIDTWFEDPLEDRDGAGLPEQSLEELPQQLAGGPSLDALPRKSSLRGRAKDVERGGVEGSTPNRSVRFVDASSSGLLGLEHVPSVPSLDDLLGTPNSNEVAKGPADQRPPSPSASAAAVAAANAVQQLPADPPNERRLGQPGHNEEVYSAEKAREDLLVRQGGQTTSISSWFEPPIDVFNESRRTWHVGGFIQFLFSKTYSLATGTSSVLSEGFYLIADSSSGSSPKDGGSGGTQNAALAIAQNLQEMAMDSLTWPFPSARMFIPWSALTFLYDDDELPDVTQFGFTQRRFACSMSCGLNPSVHPVDHTFHPAACQGKKDVHSPPSPLDGNYMAFRYLPQLTVQVPPGKGSDDRSPLFPRMPLADPLKEEVALIRLRALSHKTELHKKFVESLRSYYDRYFPHTDREESTRATSATILEDSLTADTSNMSFSTRTGRFERSTFYRHCMHRTFQMHYLRTTLISGYLKHRNHFQVLLRSQPIESLMKQILLAQSATGRLASIFTRIRTLVSLKKRRYMKDGFNLDLAEITPNIIAMGFPSTGREALLRNPMDEVLRFFETYHGNESFPVTAASLEAFDKTPDDEFVVFDESARAAFLSNGAPQRYRIFNLCSERFYPPTRFCGSFERFPSDDHNPPPLAQMLAFCKSAEAFLIGNDTKSSHGTRAASAAAAGGGTMLDDRVVVVHCKAGKGRTGVMIVALMVFMKIRKTFQEALETYNTQRTNDGKGISIASQIRFLQYFEHMLSEIGRRAPARRPVQLRQLSFYPIPWLDMDGGCTPYVTINVRRKQHLHVPLGQREVKSEEHETMVVVFDSRYDRGIPAGGDLVALNSYAGNFRASIALHGVQVVDEVQVMIYNKGGRLLKDEYLFSFWFHASFLESKAAIVTYGKMELDGASKEHAEFFDPSFKVEMEYTALAPEM